MTAINKNSILSRNESLVTGDVEGEAVMMNIANGKYYGMDKVGTRIWELMEKPLSFQEVLNALLKEYNVDEKSCEKDVLTFLEELAKDNLIFVK